MHDVKDVEALADRALADALKASGGWLGPVDRDDMLTYLIETTWELAAKYDKAKGQAFSTYAYRLLRLRTADWYRNRLGDSRYGDPPDLESAEDQRKEIAQQFDFSGPEVLGMMNSTELTPVARQAMLQLVKPMVEQDLSEAEVIRDYSQFTGRSRVEVRQMLSDLREELECRALLAA